MENKNRDANMNNSNAIAVIGMAGKFPMADNLEAFWENLKRGKDCIGAPSESRREDWRSFLGEGVDGMPELGYLETINRFDPQFFGIAPGEAAYLDPAQRLLLETVYEAMEYGGCGGERLTGTRTGVFLACGNSGYKQLIRQKDFSMVAELGNLPAISAGRISHMFDLRGPALLVDTACSSALTALHYACESIKRGECDMAIVGAVNVYAYFDGKVASIDTATITDEADEEKDEEGNGDNRGSARCRVFDDSAVGVVNGEGVGALLLKPLNRAQQDGDVICAVIKGTAVNHNGGRTATVSGLRPESMAEVMLLALENARVNPDSLSYIEASGTATRMGDPLEIKSITEVFAKYTDRKELCPVGCVKNNIGHLNHTSGLASLLKVILALQHRQIPPLAMFQTPNSYIDFKNSPVYIDTSLRDWELGENQTRRAGISSFSVNGTNCHIILEQAPLEPPSSSPDRYHILTASAQNRDSLEELCHELKETLGKNSGEDFADICYSMNVGRGHHQYRVAAVCKDVRGFVEGIDSLDFTGGACGDAGMLYGHVGKPKSASASRAVFLFSGMTVDKDLEKTCRDFYGKGFVAARYVEECRGYVDLDRYPQAMVFAFQYALAMLWRNLGIKPAYVLGFGIGKYVSRVISGKLPLQKALEICIHENLDQNSFNIDKFKQNIQLLHSQDQRLFLEIGPTNELGAVTREVLAGKPGFMVLDSYGEEDNEKTLLMSIALLYIQGVSMDFSSLFLSRMVALPTYPYNRRRYWLSDASIDPRVNAGAGPPEMEEDREEPFTGTLIPRPELGTEYVPPRTEFEKTAAGILKKFLGFEKVGIHDNFFEFGINSVTMLHINRILKKKIKKNIPIVSMFEYPTIHSLGEHVIQKDGAAGRSPEKHDEENVNTMPADAGKGVHLLHQSIGLLRNINTSAESD